MRHCDIIISGSDATLFLRPTRYSWMKSRAGKRLINLGIRLTAAEIQKIRDWIDQEQGRLGRRYDERLPLFADEFDNALPIGYAILRHRLIGVLSGVCGRRIRLHHIRHAWVQIEVVPRVAAPTCREGSVKQIGADLTGIEIREAPQARRTIELRSIAMQMGHRNVDTTCRSYLHMPWALSLFQGALSEDLFKRRLLIAASNRQAASIDKIGERLNAVGSDTKRFEALMRVEFGRGESAGGMSPMDSTLPPAAMKDLTALEFEQKLRRVDQMGDVKVQLKGVGFSRATVEHVIQAANELGERCHYRFFPAKNRKGNIQAQRRVRFGQSKNIFAPWLAWADSTKTEEQVRAKRLAELFANVIRKLHQPGSFGEPVV